MKTRHQNLILPLLTSAVVVLLATHVLAQSDAVPPPLFKAGAPRRLFAPPVSKAGFVQLRAADSPGVPPAPGASDETNAPKSKPEPDKLLNAATPGTLGVTTARSTRAICSPIRCNTIPRFPRRNRRSIGKRSSSDRKSSNGRTSL